MSKPKSAQDLARQIESLIAEFLEEHRAAASAALQRAFASAPPVGRPRAPRKAPTEIDPRRSADEMATLCDRLYNAICAQAGEAMVVLAPVVGAKPRALNLPATYLKRAGRIRTVGQRQATRHFPMPKSSARSS